MKLDWKEFIEFSEGWDPDSISFLYKEFLIKVLESDLTLNSINKIYNDRPDKFYLFGLFGRNDRIEFHKKIQKYYNSKFKQNFLEFIK